MVWGRKRGILDRLFLLLIAVCYSFFLNMFVIGFLRVLYPFIIKKIKNNFK